MLHACPAATGLHSPGAQPRRSEAKGFWWGPAWCRSISLQTIEPSGLGAPSPRDPAPPRLGLRGWDPTWLTLGRLGDLDLPIPPKGSEGNVTCIRVSLPQKPPLLVRSRTWFTTCEGSRRGDVGLAPCSRTSSCSPSHTTRAVCSKEHFWSMKVADYTC